MVLLCLLEFILEKYLHDVDTIRMSIPGTGHPLTAGSAPSEFRLRLFVPGRVSPCTKHLHMPPKYARVLFLGRHQRSIIIADMGGITISAMGGDVV